MQSGETVCAKAYAKLMIPDETVSESTLTNTDARVRGALASVQDRAAVGDECLSGDRAGCIGSEECDQRGENTYASTILAMFPWSDLQTLQTQMTCAS